MTTEIKVGLKKIRPGSYLTSETRFAIVDRYDPSGHPSVREGRGSSIRWSVEDLLLGGTRHFSTLADCREYITSVIRHECGCEMKSYTVHRDDEVIGVIRAHSSAGAFKTACETYGNDVSIYLA